MIASRLRRVVSYCTPIQYYLPMPTKLPDFHTVTDRELREIWRNHPDPSVRRVILEVVRYRKVLTEVDSLYQTIHRAWRKEVGGNLVALHLLQKVMVEEKDRIS